MVVSSNPADWTPRVLDGEVAAIIQVGNKIVAGGCGPDPFRYPAPRRPL